MPYCLTFLLVLLGPSPFRNQGFFNYTVDVRAPARLQQYLLKAGLLSQPLILLTPVVVLIKVVRGLLRRVGSRAKLGSRMMNKCLPMATY